MVAIRGRSVGRQGFSRGFSRFWSDLVSKRPHFHTTKFASPARSAPLLRRTRPRATHPHANGPPRSETPWPSVKPRPPRRTPRRRSSSTRTSWVRKMTTKRRRLAAAATLTRRRTTTRSSRLRWRRSRASGKSAAWTEATSPASTTRLDSTHPSKVRPIRSPPIPRTNPNPAADAIKIDLP